MSRFQAFLNSKTKNNKLNKYNSKALCKYNIRCQHGIHCKYRLSCRYVHTYAEKEYFMANDHARAYQCHLNAVLQENERLNKISDKYNILINDRNDIICEYKQQIDELKSQHANESNAYNLYEYVRDKFLNQSEEFNDLIIKYIRQLNEKDTLSNEEYKYIKDQLESFVFLDYVCSIKIKYYNY